jgi:hypothetical protein
VLCFIRIIHGYYIYLIYDFQNFKDFIDNEDRRTKKACPHIGEWLMLLSAWGLTKITGYVFNKVNGICVYLS